MRTFLFFIGWSSIVSSIVDGALGLYALWVILNADVLDIYFSLDRFLKHYVEFIYWVKQVALFVMPNAIALWLFSIPALIYFPARILMSMVIGCWALNKAKSLKVQ